MAQTPDTVPGAPTSAPVNAAPRDNSKGDELWARTFLMVFCCLSGLIAALLAYFYFQRPESLASIQLEDSLIRADRPALALCLYQAKALQYNIRLLIALRFLGMFVGAQCILLGALFLLKGIETSYQVHLHSERASSSINTSSPGLVLITLGAALVALTQFHDQELVAGPPPSCEAASGPAAPTPALPVARPSPADAGAPAQVRELTDGSSSALVPALLDAADAAVMSEPTPNGRHSRRKNRGGHEPNL